MPASLGVETAQAQPAVAIDLPAGRLSDALDALSRQARISIATQGPLPALRTPAVKGRMPPGEALRRLLTGSGWQARQAAPGIWRLEPKPRPTPRPAAAGPPPKPAPPVEIVVTARKVKENPANVPASISVIPGDHFSLSSPARSSSDIAAETGGVFSTNLGPGRERLFLRGVADSPFNGPTQSTVGLFLDDSRINFALPDPDLRLVDIDRMEILRGPQGTLYGSGALGGIIRIVTNRPDLYSFGGDIAVEGTTTQGGAAGGALEGYANVPLAEGQLALRAAAYTDTTGGWITDTARGRRNINRSRRTGGRADLRWVPGEGWTVDLSVAAQGLRSRDSQYATQGYTHTAAIAEPAHNRFFLVRLEANGPIGGLDFLSTTAIESNHLNLAYDASSVAASRGLDTPLAYREQRDIYLINQEFRLSRPDKWIAGVSVTDTISVTKGVFAATEAQETLARQLAGLNLEAAAFGEYRQPLIDSFDLTFGGRAFISQIYDNPLDTSGPGIKTFGVTPSATLAWHAGPGALAWLRYSSAIRPGGRSIDSSGTLTTFKADHLQSLELGSRLTLPGDALTLNATAFTLRWNRVQSDRVSTDGLVITTNVGTATNYGIELDARAKWRGFTLEAAMTAQHGRLISTVAGISDPRLPVLPDMSGRVQTGWNGTFGDWQLGAYLSGNYWSSTRLGFDPQRPLTIPSRYIMNAGVSAETGGWRVVLSLSNLLNSKADSFAFGNPFTYRQTTQHTPIRPRTAILRIDRRF
ncbi:TonB-dependent receptor domain-containing protein [Novosphingobium beihaiensis]|uniref:TonB-dependent receptor n=1 Tax=Novosphingobium beihaiensis TaxID=2930389 RepID=A0ABT0BLK7_9SPHN|nr:TonB-dependent receptor [Novosphingobium beihaiensis]MCJ2185950.1 TonB-dependent receptor [Novosphingobium beihaiensis]